MNLNIYLLLILIQLIYLNAKPTKILKGPLNPVILVPGQAGSQLYATLNKPTVPHYYCQKQTSDWFNIWLNLELVLPFSINCWVDNVVLKYDNQTRRTINQDGVQIRIQDFGNTSSIEYINPSRIRYTVYFDPIVKSLESHGYEQGLNLFGTPYDFRKNPGELDDFYENLDKIIYKSYKNNANSPASLVCHSMGCLILYMHLNKKSQEWKDTYIKNLITLGAPWGGSVKSVKEIVSGDNLGVSFMDSISIREVSRTFPSVPFLFPKPGFWREDEPLMTVELNKNRNLTYTSTNYDDLLRDLKLNDTLEMYKDVSQLITSLQPPNVEIHCFHGFGLETVQKLHFELGKFPDGNPIVLNGDGDGTVNTRSLEYCKYWKGKQNKKVNYQKFNNVEHMSTVSNLEVVKHVTEIITGIKFNHSKDLFNDENYFNQNFFSLSFKPDELNSSDKNSN